MIVVEAQVEAAAVAAAAASQSPRFVADYHRSIIILSLGFSNTTHLTLNYSHQPLLQPLLRLQLLHLLQHHLHLHQLGCPLLHPGPR